jgi:GntR family transcriptional regulator/MocR family aminotransferase
MVMATRRGSHESSAGRDLLVTMEFRRGHLRADLRSALRGAIQDGRLAAGTRLPSSRRLADDLQVSRGVVTDAYDQLVAEGYLEVAPRQAPVVAGVATERPTDAEPARPSWRFDFVATTPDVELFPRRHGCGRANVRSAMRRTMRSTTVITAAASSCGER